MCYGASLIILLMHLCRLILPTSCPFIKAVTLAMSIDHRGVDMQSNREYQHFINSHALLQCYCSGFTFLMLQKSLFSSDLTDSNPLPIQNYGVVLL